MRKEYIEEIVESVTRDYRERAEARRALETQWRLNLNFYTGNQYCTSLPSGEVADVERDYYWQEREVFNHIAPIVETRLAKLGAVRPTLTVRPFSSDDGDIKTAKTAGKILDSACDRLNIDGVLGEGAMWSELCGTSFYYVGWDERKGLDMGDGVCEGDVCVSAVSPFEIYPDNLFASEIGDCRSVIRARAVDVDEIKRIYGKSVPPEEMNVVGISASAVGGGLTAESAVNKLGVCPSERCAALIERYTAPTDDKPNGEYAVVANGTLLHYGELPYVNGTDGKRAVPFVKQVSLSIAGRFFGMSVVERTIPVQRAYNAVKNRKHEFMNRLAVGVMAVEDGSVDIDNLEQEGISPGKILVYRQGATPPRMVEMGAVPSSFDTEEARLISEFTQVSGVSDALRSSQALAANMSGAALQLLIEQDDTRLSLSAQQVRLAAREIARQILRLYKQFGTASRITRTIGKNGEPELMHWSASDISSDDVVFATDNELLSTPAMRQNMMFELYKLGLLADDNGRMSDAAKRKFMDALGYGGWNGDFDNTQLNVARAEKEQATGDYALDEFDDHGIHIDTHIRYLLGDCPRGRKYEKLKRHIKEHEAALSARAQSALQTVEDPDGDKKEIL